MKMACGSPLNSEGRYLSGIAPKALSLSGFLMSAILVQVVHGWTSDARLSISRAVHVIVKVHKDCYELRSR